MISLWQYSAVHLEPERAALALVKAHTRALGVPVAASAALFVALHTLHYLLLTWVHAGAFMVPGTSGFFIGLLQVCFLAGWGFAALLSTSWMLQGLRGGERVPAALLLRACVSVTVRSVAWAPLLAVLFGCLFPILQSDLLLLIVLVTSAVTFLRLPSLLLTPVVLGEGGTDSAHAMDRSEEKTAERRFWIFAHVVGTAIVLLLTANIFVHIGSHLVLPLQPFGSYVLSALAHTVVLALLLSLLVTMADPAKDASAAELLRKGEDAAEVARLQRRAAEKAAVDIRLRKEVAGVLHVQ